MIIQTDMTYTQKIGLEWKAFIFTMEKVKIFDFLKKKNNDQNNSYHTQVSTTNGVQIYFFFVKCHAKNNFLKDVESTVMTVVNF